MTTYRTGNPIGSTDPKDLYDNAENTDVFVNSLEHEYWDDRFGKMRRTWHGMEASFDRFIDASSEEFQQFLINSGYQDMGDYGPGLEITARNQVFRYDGELYRAGAALDLPYTTTGDWATEGSLFVAVGDQALRQQLYNDMDLYGGSRLVGRSLTVLGNIAELKDIPNPRNNETVLVRDPLRGGIFKIIYGDFSDKVAKDPSQGVWVTLNSDEFGDAIIAKRLFGQNENTLPPMNASWFGGSWDGIGDDSEAINACIEYASENYSGGSVYISAKKSFWSSAVRMRSNISLKSVSGTKVTVNRDTTDIGLHFLEDDFGIVYNAKLEGNISFTRILSWHNNNDSTSVGVLMENCRYCSLSVDIENFDSGLVILGNNEGSAHNIIKVNHISNCRSGISLLDETGSHGVGYSNSNYIYGGRVSIGSGVVDRANQNNLAVRNIVIGNRDFQNNNNTIIGVSLELAAPASSDYPYNNQSCFLRVDGGRNQFINLRLESSGQHVPSRYVDYREGSFGNLLDGGRVPNDFFRKIYDSSEVSFNPNRYEGFGRRGCKVRLDVAFNVGATFSGINWSGATYDIDGFWDSTTPSLFKVPSHVRRIKITVGISYQLSAQNSAQVRIRNLDTGESYLHTHGFSEGLQAITGILDVNPSDRIIIETTSLAAGSALRPGMAYSWADIDVIA